jgi:hypothetical protein
VVLWIYLSRPLAVKSTICFPALCSLSLLSPSFLGSAEESFTQAGKQLVVACSTVSPELLLEAPVVRIFAQSCPWCNAL